MIGSTISHYKILEKLGEGGMGVVYKAEDTKLKRTVALKFLPHHLSSNETEQSRFLQEAQAAATINHPNVCTIFDIKEEGEQQFIVMEYVEGATLRAKIPIQKIDDALACAIQIGEALHEAHNKSIVHRDIKAENIMINAKNQIKVMDFGLAKLKGSLKLTRTSSTVGTLAYMPPEQLQGGEVDARSDIFSFGVVLFEMFTGRLPFKGEHEAALMYSIVNELPDSLLKHRPDVSPELERIIGRALEKDPEDRYQHVDDVVSELRRIKKQSTRVTRTSLADIKIPAPSQRSSSEHQSVDVLPAIKKGHSLLIGGMIIGIVIIAIVGYRMFFTAPKSIDSLAVLPFVNTSGDPNTDYLSDGITESLINGLSQLSNLTVMSRSSVFHYKGNEVDPQKAGKELGVKAVLTGRVTQRGDNLLISTELVNVSNNSHIWGEQYNKKLSDILAIQEEISKEISRNLSVKLGGEEEKKLAIRGTENTEAYQLYLKGRFHWNKRKADDLQKAVEYYNQAIVKDPNFALAYAGLASTYVILPEYAGVPVRDYVSKIETASEKASELDPTLAEPHAVLGLMRANHEWKWSDAEKEFKRAIELNPNYPTTHHWYCINLRMQGRFEEALSEIKRAQELDPLSLIINLNVAEVFIAMHRDDEAKDQLKKTLDLDPNFPGAHLTSGMFYAQQGKLEEALHEMQKVREIVGPDNAFGIQGLGYVYAKAGKRDEAVKILNRLIELSRQGFTRSTQIAQVYLGLGEMDKTFEWLEKSYEEQNNQLGYLKVVSVWDDLRSDPRYHALLKKIGLEK